MAKDKIDVQKALVEQKEQDRANGISDPGTPYFYAIDYKYNEESGIMEPYFKDPIDLDEQIQLAKSQVDIDVIMKRWRAGDTSVLNVKPCYYGDISEIPTNINDASSNLKAVNDMFTKLNPEIKALFGNNINKMGEAINDGSFTAILKNYYDSKKPKEEVKADE